MHNRHSNSAESFQLLQLSDDSKSLSDLELPQVVFQRKRKVRSIGILFEYARDTAKIA